MPNRIGVVWCCSGRERRSGTTGPEGARQDVLGGAQVSGETIDALLTATSYQQADVTKAEDLQRLIDKVTPAPAIYFALPPAVTAKACDALGEVNLPVGTVLVLEKPFGIDENSTRTLNTRLARLVPEERTFRVDHFLGRSTVLNLLGVRFANRIFEPAYGEVLAGVLDGDPKLAVRGDTAVDCWRIIDPVLAAWRAGQTRSSPTPPGSQGPEGWPT